MAGGYGTGPFGHGPFGTIGGVIVPFLLPLGGYGGLPYGHGSYGSIQGFGPPVIPVTAGYGAYPYGHGPYGSIGSDESPKVVGVVSIDGFTIEIFFGTEMMVDAALLDVSSYTFTPIAGAAPTIPVLVEVGVMGTWGATSVLVHHSGTTLGGLYQITVQGVTDLGGTIIEAYFPQNQYTLWCKGSPPAYQSTALTASEVLLTFDFPILDEGSWTPGVLQLEHYAFHTSYPQTIIPTAVTHPYTGDAAKIKLDVIGMTVLPYEVEISPALALLYDGTYLPPTSTTFGVQELGSGTSSLGPDGLVLKCGIGSAYGWRFFDQSGKLLPQSSLFASLQLDLSAFPTTPEIDGDVFYCFVSDGDFRVEATFYIASNQTWLQITSGGFSYAAQVPWDATPLTISFVRNQIASTWTILVDGEVFVADQIALFTAPAGMSPGIQLFCNPAALFDLQVVVRNVRITSSQTIFSEAWNFLHNHLSQLQGIDGLAKKIVATKKGPLVKGWGDATPATKQNVHLYINGVEVEVGDVNPYVGSIFPVVPIPLVPPGTMTVFVDYIWFPEPTFPFVLNTEGSSLNRPGCVGTCPVTDSTEQFLGGGYIPPGWKFPMGVVLGFPTIHQPLLRSPRHVGLEHDYTSALNSPTSLVLNQDPHRVSKPYDTQTLQGVVVFYEGTEDPVVNGWSLVGEVDAQIPSVGGVWTLSKPSQGSFGEGHPTLYTQSFDATPASTIIVVVRFQIQRDLVVPFGVFTGVGFGAHTQNHMYFVGALDVLGVMHLGMLVDPAHPEERTSWVYAHTKTVQVIGTDTCTIPTSDVPVSVQERLRSEDVVRFQIMDGAQAGIYTMISVFELSQDLSALVVSPPFPADFKLWDQAFCTIVFETPWDGDGFESRPTTYRLMIENDRKTIPLGRGTLSIGGGLSGEAIVQAGVPAFAIPPDSILTLVSGPKGQIFWGSLERQASNHSTWNFVRYGVEPSEPRLHTRGFVVAAEMNAVPEVDPNRIWYKTEEWGQTQIDSTGDRLLLEATSSSSEVGAEGLDLTMAYARQEPFLTRTMAIDVDAVFLVEQSTQGSGDAWVQILDGTREVRLSTLLFVEELGGRQLRTLASRSLCGLFLPKVQDWEQSGTAEVRGKRIFVAKTSTTTFQCRTTMDEALEGGRVVGTRLTYVDIVGPDQETGIRLEVAIGTPGGTVGVGLRWKQAASLVIYSSGTFGTVAELPFVWNDGVLHTYRLVTDPNVGVLSLMVDDVVLGTWALSDFAIIPASTEIVYIAGDLGVAGTIVIHDISMTETAPLTARRTLGVYLGGDAEDINAWEVPRTDALTVPNSDLAAVVEEMDWRDLIKVRVHRDPSWGVTILRTDLPPPPYFTGTWSTQTTQPSAGWINVEYRDLPPSSDHRVAFGALDSRSISRQRWDRVRYRLYKYPSEDVVVKFPMVLNRANVLTSGEVLKDTTVEVYNVLSRDATTVSLRSINIYASRVFLISYTDVDQNQVVLTDESFVFDVKTQTITLVEGLTFRPLVGPTDPISDLPGPLINPQTIHVIVTVSFSPGKPYTHTYVCSQPLLDGVTLLNEGTPPMVGTQTGDEETTMVWGSAINDENDLLGEEDFILNDPFRYLDSFWPSGVVYEDVERCEKSEGETCLLTPFCDDSIPGAAEAGGPGLDPWDIGNGLIGFELGGFMFNEQMLIFSDGPNGPFGQQLSSVFLKASGDGAPFGGYLQEAILFTPLGPNTPPGDPPALGWSVFGILYDTLTQTYEVLYFGTEAVP